MPASIAQLYGWLSAPFVQVSAAPGAGSVIPGRDRLGLKRHEGYKPLSGGLLSDSVNGTY